MTLVSKTLGAALALAVTVTGAQALELDAKLPTYQPTSGVAGNIKSVGSDTMNNLMTLWAEGFKELYPSVQVEIEGKGSSTAPASLIQGTSNFGPMSRKMKDKEVDAFEKTFGYKPVQLPTSIDMLAVFVHKDNPVAGLSLQQLDAIFSSTRKGGAGEDITRWGQLGLEGEWAAKPISLYGRNSASGTYGYFKKHALFKGDYKDSVKEQPGSSSVIQGIASDKFAIGYSGIGYMTADVRAVPLAEKTGDKAIPASAEYAYTGDYPLARFLWLSVNVKPNTELDPLRREFIKYIFSKQGQEVVIKDGYYPVTAEVARDALGQAGIKADF
ncbi:MAG: phosphate ABC transporter substrate-binding protein [Planctomycetota bacterium]|jgi:phosphate transport system substrate-binding protein|nr:phosphate ABC transporter substrate-binding protein [Planctomycetota bacterium]